MQQAPNLSNRVHNKSYDVLKKVEQDAEVVDSPDEAQKPKHESEQSGSRKILFLDGMRGVAAMLVVCQHAGYLHGREIGALGVHTFFVLSAFLLTMILEKKFRALRNEHAPSKRWVLALLDYGARRVLRVYPLFVAVVLVISMSSDKHKKQWWWVRHLGKDYSAFKILTFGSQYRYYVLWSLPVELKYYWLIPVFTGGVVALRKWWWLPMVPLSIWIVYTGLYEYRRARLTLNAHAPTFVCGSVAAVVYNRASDWIKANNFVFRWWHIALVRVVQVTSLLLILSVCFDALIFDWYGPYPFKVKQKGDQDGDHFVSVYVAVLIVTEMLAPGAVSSVFEWSVLRHAGQISFSMYLLHPRIINSDFMQKQKNYYSKYFATWILVFFWGTVSFYMIEYPSQLLATHIGKKIKALDNAEKLKGESSTLFCCR